MSLEEPVKAAGNEIFVRREYYRLAPRPTLLKGVLYDRVPLRDGESIKSGERVEVVVTVDAKNDYEYLLFEDLKPAGFEAVELQSGEPLCATQAEDRRHGVGLPGTARPQSGDVHRPPASRACGRSATRCAPKTRARSTRCRCWARRCTCRK